MRYWLLFSLVTASLVHADWQLSEPSELTFLSTKNTHITEVHHFRKLTGSIDQSGYAQLIIDLASVDTGIPIRNERMQTLLFDTSRFTSATLTVQIDADVLKQAAAGNTVRMDLHGKLSLHGMEQDIISDVMVIPAKDGSLVVTNNSPILIQADQFGLLEGIRKLRDIAKLKEISETVPVSFTLTFVPE